MDLFHMKRYWSEDDVVGADDDRGESENNILSRLKSKALKKPLEQNEDESGGLKNKVKKRRKRKNKATLSEAAEQGGFTVLGDDLDQTRKKVRRVLPNWLANPDVVSVDLKDQQMSVNDLPGLDEETIANLVNEKITHFFPVQRQLIPYLLANESQNLYRPHDICVSAPTGSGKTLAFVLPVVQRLKDRVVPRIRALVILPVQDLATQVYRVFQRYCEGTSLRVKLLSGQKPFKQEQMELVKPDMVGGHHSLADIIVATPGRIVDHIQKTSGFSLEHLRFLIVDEADRVMEDVQNDWLHHVENAVFSGNRQRPGPLTVANSRKRHLPLQKLLFSATLSQNPEKLEQMNLFEPKLFTSIVQPKDIHAKVVQAKDDQFIGKYTTPAELSEVVVKIKEPLNKPMVLEKLISGKKMKKALIFTKSSESVHTLMVLLKHYGYKVGELSSKLNDKRRKTLGQFNDGNFDLLVCTDALARGMDMGEIDFVVSYDSPIFIKTYVHRVGRTARAGKEGTAITLIAGNEEKKFRSMLQEAGKADCVKEETINEDDLDRVAYEAAKNGATEELREETHKTHKKKIGQ